MTTDGPRLPQEPFTADETARIWARARLLIRQSLNEGVGLLLGGMFLLTLAAICGRMALATGISHNAQVAAELRALTVPNEPRRDDPYLGVGALVLAPINTAFDTLSALLARQHSFERGTILRGSFIDLADALVRAQGGGPTQRRPSPP